MSGTGTWSKVIDFVSTLDSLPYASKIEEVNFTRSGANMEAGTSTDGKAVEPLWNFNLDLAQNLKATQ